MPTLAEATVSETERRVLERLVGLLRADPRLDVRAVWLYGSRARGERPHPESDVDVLVITSAGRSVDTPRVDELALTAAGAEGGDPFDFSVRVRDPDWLAGRREIDSFFIQEVDRDKIVLFGEP